MSEDPKDDIALPAAEEIPPTEDAPLPPADEAAPDLSQDLEKEPRSTAGQPPTFRSKAQFQDEPAARPRPPHALVPLGQWRSEGETFGTLAKLPDEPGLYVLRSADIRVIAAALRAAAAPKDRSLDLDAATSDDGASVDGHSLLQLLRLHLAGADTPGRFAIHPGLQGTGLEFWQVTSRQADEISDLCRTASCAVYVAAVGPQASAYLPGRGLTIIDIDPRPLIEALARGWESAANRLDQISELIDGHQIDLVGLIKALDARDEEQLDSEIEAAARKQPYVAEVASFIGAHILESDEPAVIAAAFTAACFDELTSNEFRRIAQDLAETPDLVETPPTNPDDPAPPLRTRVREATLATIEVRPRDRRGPDGTRLSLLVLRGAQRYRELLRRELPNQAIFTSARLVEQMSSRLDHGVIAPQRWGPCCDVIGQTLVNEGGAAPDALGARLAAFWLSTDSKPVFERERVRNITLHGDMMLRRLCERAAELANVDSSRTQAETSIALTRHAHAVASATAWRTPATAAFLVQSLGTLPVASAEPLLQACLEGPRELLTLVCTSLTGGFGFTARGETDSAHLDALLASLADLIHERDGRGDALRRLALGMTWRLAAIRLVSDASRISEGEAPTISDALAAALVRYASVMAQADPTLFDELPFDATWLDRNEQIYLALAQGWRAPPDCYEDPESNRAAVLAAELAFVPTMRVLDALTGHRRLLSVAQRRQILEAFGERLGFTGVPIETVALWIPEQFDWTVEIDEASLGEHAADVHAANAGFHRFRDLMAQLRRAIPLLAVAFSQARIVASDGTERIEVSLPQAVIEVARDRECWSGLRAAADALRDMLGVLDDSWRDATVVLPRTEQLRAASRQTALQRRVFSAWWSALGQARA